MSESDQEQIEVVKQWWRQYGAWVIACLLLFVAVYGGYYWYSESLQQRRYAASALFDELLQRQEANPADDESARLVEQLKTDYSDLGYGTLAALLQAKNAMEQGDYEQALGQLGWAEKHAAAELRSLVSYRKAQVLYASDQLNEALTTLAELTGEHHQAISHELKGDILLEQGDVAGARLAFQAALEASAEQAVNNPYLQIKVDDLAQP